MNGYGANKLHIFKDFDELVRLYSVIKSPVILVTEYLSKNLLLMWVE